MTKRKVSLVKWGDIESLDAPIQWGLKVDDAYVCRGREVLLFDTRGEAAAEGKRLRARLNTQAQEATQ
jgi:hypothetical protein